MNRKEQMNIKELEAIIREVNEKLRVDKVIEYIEKEQEKRKTG